MLRVLKKRLADARTDSRFVGQLDVAGDPGIVANSAFYRILLEHERRIQVEEVDVGPGAGQVRGRSQCEP